MSNVGCMYCKHNIKHEGPEIDLASLCTAPQLGDHLDDGVSLTQAQGARDIRALCGQAARWFEHKE